MSSKMLDPPSPVLAGSKRRGRKRLIDKPWRILDQEEQTKAAIQSNETLRYPILHYNLIIREMTTIVKKPSRREM